jgi:hypothetical protein
MSKYSPLSVKKQESVFIQNDINVCPPLRHNSFSLDNLIITSVYSNIKLSLSSKLDDFKTIIENKIKESPKETSKIVSSLCENFNQNLSNFNTNNSNTNNFLNYSPMIAIRIAENNEQIKAMKKHVEIQDELNFLKDKTLIFPYNFLTIKIKDIEVSFEENLLTMGKGSPVTFTDIDNINENDEHRKIILFMILHGLLEAASYNITNFDLSKDNLIIKDISNYSDLINKMQLNKKFVLVFEENSEIKAQLYQFDIIYIPVIKDLTSAKILTSKDFLKGNELVIKLKENITQAIDTCGLRKTFLPPNYTVNTLNDVKRYVYYLFKRDDGISQ